MKLDNSMPRARAFLRTKPAYLLAGLLLCRMAKALIPGVYLGRSPSHQRRSFIRPRSMGGLRCSAGDGETENAESSEIYAAIRRRLQVSD